MAKSKDKKTQNSKQTRQQGAFMTKRLMEVLFIAVVALSLFTLLSLLTYHIRDNFALSGNDIANAGGLVGAWISRALFIMFGYVAYSLPVGLMIVSFSALKRKKGASFNVHMALLRSAGLILLLMSLTGLFSLEHVALRQILPVSSGGLLGAGVANTLYALFSSTGSFLLLSGGALIGLTLLTDISWLGFIEAVGKYALLAATFLAAKMSLLVSQLEKLMNWVDERKKRRKALKEEKELELEQAASQPIIRPKTSRVSKAKSVETVFDMPIEPVDITFKPVVASPKRNNTSRAKITHTKGDIPSIALLSDPIPTQSTHFSAEELEARSREVEQKLLDFGVEVNVVAVHPGPVITRFELQLAPGLKVSKITTLGKDLARSLSVTSVRVVEVIPGKAVVGLELPNPKRDVVCLSEVLATEQYEGAKSYLSLALGVDISGHPVIVDLAKMPHLLVAGTTGSGKSVCINAMLLSLILKATPEDVRLILVDPKMLELAIYEGIPHLLAPVVTDMKDAASALRWCVAEMERRYRLMASLGVRNITSFNQKVKEAESSGEPLTDPLIQVSEEMEPQYLTTLPKIVVVIDELADMMMVVGKKVEQLIARIAQKARASGIHLILATQRPSVDVLTGLIKSNIPTRVSFQVSSKIDSRTILDQQGAEQLLGQGDMLYLPPGTGTPVRVHGAFVDDNEVHRVVNAWREVSEPDYISDITQTADDSEESIFPTFGDTEDVDALYDEAVQFVIQSRKASISSVQRRFKIGYNRAARLVEEMERTGLVGPLEGGSREVLAPVANEES